MGGGGVIVTNKYFVKAIGIVDIVFGIFASQNTNCSGMGMLLAPIVVAWTCILCLGIELLTKFRFPNWTHQIIVPLSLLIIAAYGYFCFLGAFNNGIEWKFEWSELAYYFVLLLVSFFTGLYSVLYITQKSLGKYLLWCFLNK